MLWILIGAQVSPACAEDVVLRTPETRNVNPASVREIRETAKQKERRWKIAKRAKKRW